MDSSVLSIVGAVHVGLCQQMKPYCKMLGKYFSSSIEQIKSYRFDMRVNKLIEFSFFR